MDEKEISVFFIKYLILTLDGVESVTQCVAVTTQEGSTKDPPQNGKPDVVLN